ncbi:hypothetical protein Agub_g9135 [Astrephomene gubernaculifera]|uniref:starch synthase n=1 Tax=Astrephomene gubernaculifera TaxID=47775 RepID=A0AAD3HNQ7_9CHLO|nr:hypothetical protein Agub_g9135 [Astrephomene gubernaculifera]
MQQPRLLPGSRPTGPRAPGGPLATPGLAPGASATTMRSRLPYNTNTTTSNNSNTALAPAGGLSLRWRGAGISLQAATRGGRTAPQNPAGPGKSGKTGGANPVPNPTTSTSSSPSSPAAAAAASAPSAPAAKQPSPATQGRAGSSSSTNTKGSSSGGSSSSGGGSSSSPVTLDKAMAAKIHAARELARRLAEEKQAASAAASKGQDVEGGKRAAEVASAEAAAQAARADALLRALRRAEGQRDTLQRLRAENEALRELLVEVAVDKEAARRRMQQVLDSLGDQALVERTRAALAAAAAGATALAAPSTLPPLPVPPMGTAAPVTGAPTAGAGAGAAGGINVLPPGLDDAAVAAAVEAGLVAASAVVAEGIMEQQAAPPVLLDEALAAEVRSLLQQQEPPAEEAIKHAAKWAAEHLPAATPAPAPSPAATAAVQQLHRAIEAAPPPAPPAVAAAVEAAPAPAAEAVAAAPAAPAAPPPAVAPPVVAPPPPTPPAPPVVPEPSLAQLQSLAARAAAAGHSVFTWPEEGGLVGHPVRIFYNRTRGPLPPPPAGSGRGLQLKAGLNKWEEICTVDMKRATGLQSGGGQEWWVAELSLPSQLFQLDFVVQDSSPAGGGAVDNNGWRDFRLTLQAGAPSEDEVAAARAEAYRRFDEERRKLIEEEERRLWRLVESRALDAAAEARVEFRRRREAELLAAAKQVVADRRRPEITAVPAAPSRPGVYSWCGGPPRAGQRAFLAYNKVHGSGGGGLPHAAVVRVHMGYDGWWNKMATVTDLAPLTSSEELARHGLSGAGGMQWYGAWIDVPYSAAVLNFVFSDREQRNWDNNGTRDYHTLVADPHSGDQLVGLLHAAMQRDAAAADKEVEDRAALRAVRKVEAKGLTLRKRREVVHEFLYTVPLTPRAGAPLHVYYRPEATMLRGRPEIWLRAGWNRLGAAACNAAGGALRPLTAKLEPCLPGGLGFYKATVQVPSEAWGVDLSFSDSEAAPSGSAAAGGFEDDNGGLDYHIPVEGGTTPRPSLDIVHVAVEMAPIAKVGGMGDVVTALGRAVQEAGHRVSVIVPKYDVINYKLVDDLVQEGGFNWGGTHVRVWRGAVEGLATTFLEPENGMFWAGCIYGRNDDAQRFAFFCGAAAHYLHLSGRRPHILHCHDWQSAPIAWAGERGAAKAVFTIHNLSYGADLIGRAMQSCDVATTVSPTYAREIAGHPSVAAHLNKLYGVLNGIDQDIWDPSEDPCLPLHYSPDTAAAGKEAARRALRQRLNLAHADVPVVGCVTRLVAQKGIHLIKHAAWRTLERGGQFVLLGSAPDSRVQGEFNALRDQLARAYPDRAALVFTYDEPLSHLIYAGSDMFLVPSMFEPCGLTQMIAMRYGTIPVVRKTGGLVDTVFDVDHDEERAGAMGMETNGFSFEGTDFAGMDYALNRALSAWYSDKQLWHSLRRRAMMQDWSWNSPALDYLELYHKALKS